MGKAKRPSLGSLSSLLERDCDETETKKATGYHKTSRSLDMDAMICDGELAMTEKNRREPFKPFKL